MVHAKPNVMISALDAARLERLLETMPKDSFPERAALEAELERAEIVDAADVPSTVVTMNSTVRFRVTDSDEEFCRTLVYPKDADADGGTISILAPVGSALIGLAEGDEIEWPKPGGGTLRVQIKEIVKQAARADETQG
jgi:regulator of nucleoside diphosphate kinase